MRIPNHGRRLARPILLLARVVVVLLALAFSAAPVSATMLDHIRSTVSYDDIRWDCGYPMRVVGTVTDVVQVRAAKGAGGVTMVTDAYSFDETWTNADGASFRQTGVGVGKDTTAKRIEGSLYEFTYKNPGLTTLYDASGHVLYRDRGVITFRATIDLAAGIFTFLGASVSGPHPAGDMEMCKAVAPIVGTASADYLTARPIGSTSFPMNFYEYLPPTYHATGTPSPLLIALNGYGENGDGTAGSISRLLATGIPRFMNIGGWPLDRPFVVLALQHVQTSDETGCTSPKEVHDLIEYARDTYNIDESRIYVTGLSCGAIGTWRYLATYLGDQVAAAVPIAGDGREAWDARGCELGTVPIWAFHGELDDVVDPQGSIVPMTHLQVCPGVPANEARLTIYPGLYHDGWDQAYSGSLGDDIYSWMLSFTRN